MNGLNQKIVSGVSWSAVETISFTLVKFVIGIVLARLLMPSDFGTLGILLIFVSISEILVDAGFGQAYIHKRTVSPTDADTVFIINFAISLVIYAILFFSAPLLAGFYELPELTWLIRAISIVIVINSLNVIQNAIVRRKFLFRKRAVLNFLAAAISGIIGIACAYSGLGVWSLVIQHVMQKSLFCLMLYASLRWHFTFSFSWAVVKEMMGYGTWILLSNIVDILFQNTYKFSIGKIFPVSELGYYERARQFNSLVSDTFTGMIGRVAFPSFSKVQDDTVQLKRMTCQFVKYTAMLVMPLVAILNVISEPLILFLLTEKWLQAAQYLRLMCFAGFLFPFYFFVSPLLQATTNMKFDFWTTTLLGVLRVINVVCLYRLGIPAIILGEAVCLILFVVISSYVARKSLGFHYLWALVAVWKIIFFIVIVIAVGYLVSAVIIDMNLLLRILLPSVLMYAVYLSLIMLFERNDIVKVYRKFTHK